MKHLYVHIPFCRARCRYCDFSSEVLRAPIRHERASAYMAAVKAELADRGSAFQRPVDTVYVGGGTPTALPEDELFGLVTELAALQPEEFTIEANPGTVDTVLLHRLAVVGVNRLSLGVQSFSAASRAALGRAVSDDEIEASLAAMHDVGWRNWNLDLVFGIPGQTWADSVADIEAAVAAGPTHVSLYDLTYTPRYAAWVARTRGAAAHRAAAAFSEEYYHQAAALLGEAGYERYEVSNFARSGYECRHNLAYWRGRDYLGVGASAVSTTGEERRTNPATVRSYLAGELAAVESVSARTRLWERAMLGLRTREGVDEQEVASVLDQAALQRLLSQGCLERRCGKLRVNPGFMDVNNSVLAALLVDLNSLGSD